VMSWQIFERAIRTLSELVMRNEVHGGFRPSVVVGVNPGGAIVGSILYYLNRDRFHFTTLWPTEGARLLPTTPALDELVRMTYPPPKEPLRILLVDDSMKSGRSIKSAETALRQAIGDNCEIRIKSAVVLHRPTEKTDTKPDYFAEQDFTHLPYTEA
jgi:hypoxanthine phosphoribosyltransferase